MCNLREYEAHLASMLFGLDALPRTALQVENNVCALAATDPLKTAHQVLQLFR